MSAPLNAFKTVAVFAKKKIVFEGNTLCRTPPKKRRLQPHQCADVERLDEIIDARELAKRWQVPQTWIRNWTREGYANDPIPHVKLGRYVRFEWGSRLLSDWWEKRRR